ncbi:MAG: hypothetical protein JSU72_02580 [Deltaproteobacteria bacterium]|nr:MAG: hypothetical protein JSU72_02580 [Deltaproteobacteria bacterium]
MKSRWLAFLILAVGVLGCAEKDDLHLTKLARIKGYAEAQVKIEHLRKRTKPDWTAIEKLHHGVAPLVREVDGYGSTSYGSEIALALKKCSRGDRVEVNQQVLAKGLQHVTTLAMTRELDLMANSGPAQRQETVQYVAGYFEGIRPTFTRRDRDYFAGVRTLEASADRAILYLKKTASAGPAQILSARRELEQVILRTYALCVLFEISEIEDYRNKDLATCDVKRMEALIFYRIIQPRIRRGDLRADEALTAILHGPYAGMAAGTVREYLQRGLPEVPLG